MTDSNLRRLYTLQDDVKTVHYRNAKWSYDTGECVASAPDFTIKAKHDRGDAPFGHVWFEVFVGGRQSNQTFVMNRNDCETLAAMLLAAANEMIPVEEEDQEAV